MSQERPLAIHQHDLGVVIAGLALLAVGGLAYHASTAPVLDHYSQQGLGFDRPGNWLPSQRVAPPPPRLLAGVDVSHLPGARGTSDAFHEVYSYAPDPDLRLEVRIDQRPAYGNLRGVLGFQRRNRYGELYRRIEGRTLTIDGVDWLFTRFQYAYKPDQHHSPRTALGLEYATLSAGKLYVVTIHGAERQTAWLRAMVEPSLRVPADADPVTLSPLLSTGARIHREVIKQALPGVVLVMAVDFAGGRLVPVSGGSGTIVSRDGSVLTNFHVVHDSERNRLHDLFVIGRFRSEDSEPEYVCAGRPNRSKLVPEEDLALIKCDLDMDGQNWVPHDWPALPVDLSETAVRGERLWVIGYPDVGGGNIRVSTGEVTGTVRDDTDGETAFLVTTASVTFGTSGGAAVDENGFYIGTPSAFRARARLDGQSVTRLGDEGLIRPVQRAADLIAVAQAGWTPTLGANQVGPQREPTAAEPQSGVQVSSVVRDAANDNPVAGAVVIVFKPGVRAEDVDMNRLYDTTSTWGRTNEEGLFTLQDRLPRGQRYTVAVLGRGFQPLVQSGALDLPESAPGRYDPWGVIHLER